jgi:SAM-dependent methyltransferase
MSARPIEFPRGAFDRLDQGDDSLFYAPSRLVTHIDDLAIAALRQFYGKILRRGAVVLDLMSSWVSHLPDDLDLAEVIGHGMNEQELAANPRLTQRFVQDLNGQTELPLETGSIDAVLCCVSVQYLQKPIDVFDQVRRVLKPGSPFIVSYSNRCFPTKAVAIWRSLDMQGHAALIRLYLEQAGFDSIEIDVLSNGARGDPLIVVTGCA